jgi:hypothetical protein
MAYESRKLELRDKKRNWRSTASTGTRLKITNIAEIKDKFFIVKANAELIKYT